MNIINDKIYTCKGESMEYSLCEELKNVYQDEVFDTETMKYRIDGFVEAMNLPILEGNIKRVQAPELGSLQKRVTANWDVPQSDFLEKQEGDFILKVYHIKNSKQGWLRIESSGQGLSFYFDNSYDKRIYDNEVCEIPFTVNVNKPENGLLFSMHAEKKGRETYFEFSESSSLEGWYDSVSFKTSRSDMENVLMILMQFMENPMKVFDIYKGIMSKKETMYSNREVNSVSTLEKVNIDKKGKILEKVIK